MEELATIFSYEVFIVAFAASIILWALNRFSSGLEKDFMKNKWVLRFMPIYPFILAGVFSLCIHPDSFGEIPQQLIWSTIPALMSNVGFKIIKSIVFEKYNVELPDVEEKKNDSKPTS